MASVQSAAAKEYAVHAQNSFGGGVLLQVAGTMQLKVSCDAAAPPRPQASAEAFVGSS